MTGGGGFFAQSADELAAAQTGVLWVWHPGVYDLTLLTDYCSPVPRKNLYPRPNVWLDLTAISFVSCHHGEVQIMTVGPASRQLSMHEMYK